jgi:hypothetical protein
MMLIRAPVAFPQAGVSVITKAIGLPTRTRATARLFSLSRSNTELCRDSHGRASRPLAEALDCTAHGDKRR